MGRKKPAVSDDELFKIWSDWVEKIHHETVSLAHNRQMFRRIAEMFNENKRLRKVGGGIWDWLSRNYVAAAAMSLRRELDKRAGAKNLRHLLHDIEGRPTVLSRERYEAMWPLNGADSKAREFQAMQRDRSFNRFQLVKNPRDSALDHIDPNMVKADLNNLSAETEKVRAYIEKAVAHRMESPVASVTFDEFDAAVDAVQKMIKKYYLLLTQTSVARFEPVPQCDIDAPFRFPWLPAKRRGRTRR